MKLKRYAVRCPGDIWLGNSTGQNYELRCPGYAIVKQERCRLWHRRADATKAAKGYFGTVVEVEVSFDD